ncbi:NucA/NucB deoxyribonuclease domain-containing protein [Streptomyces sp. NBC_01237]|uniref:NucA/NucB deoxyribonuclease domain-containing protein n=1 Tax=Streptomyces sp. NBC_01237 TaxID=2903790 RepID=UPI002DDB78E6|nr:hypothetical protein [Streptomyces sp. NBC_01237]WRZ77235.1 hypothetical protein OG251_36885 [Streptomyces sp. NBC_01237]
MGTIEYHTFEYTWARAVANLRSAYTVSLTPWRVTGVGIAGTTLLARGTCESNCVVEQAPPVRQPLAMNVETTAGLNMLATTTGRGASGDVWARMNLQFDTPGGAPVTTRDVRSLGLRCDNALPGNNTSPGCVFSGSRPILVLHYNDPSAGWNALNVGWSIYTGLPAELTRLLNPADSKGNGDRACPSGGAYPRPVGYECDEYPFRSTQEGAKTSGTPFAPRTFSFCQLNDTWPNTPVVSTDVGPLGWSRCNIPGPDNQAGGQILSKFYIDQRVLSGEKFLVVPTD